MLIAVVPKRFHLNENTIGKYHRNSFIPDMLGEGVQEHGLDSFKT